MKLKVLPLLLEAQDRLLCRRVRASDATLMLKQGKEVEAQVW
jgi:hypothetical protein